LYAEITLQHEKIFEYGSNIEKIVSMGYSRAEAMEVLSHEFERITATETVKRNSADHGLVYAVLNQSSQLKDSFCADWQVYQFSELCKKIKFMRVKPLKKIIEVESRGTTFFLILRGSVRVFKAHPKGATSVESVVGLDKKRMLYVEDLSAGECFGEDVLSGLRTRMITVQAITAVELAVIDESDFTMVQEKSTFKMTVEDRYQFLSNVPLFKNWEPYNLYRIAHVLEHTELEKGTTIVKPG
jgi:CRP-like cAMP-binding protein